jgi:hypothetical protein
MARLPYPPEAYEQAQLEGALIRAAHEAEPYGIRPDGDTAAAIGWSGAPWRPDAPIDPKGATSRPEPQEEAEADEDEGDGASADSAVPPEPEAAPEQDVDVQVPFVLDSPADAEDALDRGPFALFLARRLHLIWCQINGHAPDRDGKPLPAAPPDSDTFIAHVDSPWGGGKSTFANFIARVLDPRGESLTAYHFLRSSLAPTKADADLQGVSLAEVFVPPYAQNGTRGSEKWPGARRPWIIARYNAWRDQFVQPPWWQIFLTLHAAVAKEVRRDAVAEIRAGRIGSGLKGLGRWLGVHFGRLTYQVWNSKLKAQVGIAALTSLLLLVLWWTGVARAVFSGSNPKTTADWITLAVAVLGLGGASIATFFTVLTQSFSPDLDFTSEHKQIGVRDPIQRFRGMFERVLRATDRPILLIVDDIDRCEPATVVEIMRGFQTIIRSPRLFVLLLGDRAWIEGAHDVYHKDLLALEGGEAKLGALYVRKVIQLSFRLPVMKAEARRRFARRVLGERDEQSAERVTSELKEVEQKTREIASGGGSIGAKEAAISAVIKQAARSFAALPDAQRIVATAAASEIAETQVVVAAGADTAQQREVFNAVTQLIDCLPNNPRQIKRIFMAFATYEQVGRRLFGYKLTPTGDDGELKARRWRQLAMWVTLAVEWPETWRAVARRPELLDAAYGPEAERSVHEGAIMKVLTDAQKPALAAVLRRLRSDPSLVALLSGEGTAGLSAEAEAFAHTAMEPAAVYEFNRIIWEPDFQLQANLAG